ncbi:hypothetical protein ATN84_18110 [Paramesorhizobium deserti]|uniref:DUF3606 domain-containing protein n=1 Tax=Paramesorhizobium deserti TaxID=1494590 RepID=A0A135HRS3_9HYPH|nr:hypothetical protein [Paramesorhizobium deserti]KXF75870.1 hypothetical protein ATN84_18110 [Paramesorhizobium deserti]
MVDRIHPKQQYSVEYFAKKHRITPFQAEMILRHAGGAREAANEEAIKFKAALLLPFRVDGRSHERRISQS